MRRRRIKIERLILVLAVVAAIAITAGSIIWNGFFILKEEVGQFTYRLQLTVDETKLQVPYGSDFDPLAIVSEHNGSLEVQGTVNTLRVGSYPITYILKNEADRKEFSYTVVVEDKDAPIITLQDTYVTVTVGDSGFDPVMMVSSVEDPVDGQLEYANQLQNGSYTLSTDLDINSAGTYTVNVIARDKSGLETVNQFYVIVTNPAAMNPYYIQVNRMTNTVTVYSYDQTAGSYSIPVKVMLCSVGAATPTGVFHTFNRSRWRALFGNVYGQYVTDIVNDILFHSIPYYSMDPADMQYSEFNKLGTAASHGCVRLCVEDVKWIYENCPIGTTVEIYDNADDPGPLGMPNQIILDTESPHCGWDPTDPDPNNPWHQ